MTVFQRALLVLGLGASVLSASPALCTPSSAAEVTPPPEASNPAVRGVSEARAMWVVRYSLLSPAQVHAVVERAYRYHFNALMVQIRGRGDAYYGSSIEPRAESLLNQPADFDPLAQVVREAHLHGIKVFAWFDAMLVWTGSRPPISPRHVVNLHPEWIDSRYDGSPMSGTDYEGEFLNPGIPAVRQYTVRVCEDLVRQYDIDGIQLDYIRYPSPTLGYNPECMAGFYASLHPDEANPPEWKLRAETRLHPHEWALWKQQQVTELVREIRAAIHAEKPWLSLSAAVWADLDDARDNRMQDWPTWLHEGLVDFVCPMAYSTSTARVVHQIRQALALSSGREIWAGLGAWLLTPRGTAAKIRAVRELGVSGVCLFSYDGMTEGRGAESYLAALSHGPFQRPAHFPVMAWLPQAEKVETARLPQAENVQTARLTPSQP